jgi:hypothetical protein
LGFEIFWVLGGCELDFFGLEENLEGLGKVGFFGIFWKILEWDWE